MTSDDVRMAVFGSFDGLTSVVGLILAAIVTQADVVAVTFALAVSAAVSMAAGEWLADDAPDGRARRATLMGVSTLVASVLPVGGFFFAKGVLPIFLAGVIVVAIGVAIAEIRPGDKRSSYLKTFSVLALACALACGAALVGQALAA